MHVQLLALPDELVLFQKPEISSLVGVGSVGSVVLNPITTNEITTKNIFMSNYFLPFLNYIQGSPY